MSEELLRLSHQETAEEEVRLYIFDVPPINGARYGGQIPARNFADAAEMVKSFGGTVIGQLEESIAGSLCGVCASDIKKDYTVIHPLPDDKWQEEFE